MQTLYRYTSSFRTYNLTIDTTHTYYVLAGSMPVLVHNCEPWSSPGRLAQKYAAHGKEFGSESIREYEDGAIDLTCQCDGGRRDVLRRVNSTTGKTYYYDPESGEFAITYTDPTTRACLTNIVCGSWDAVGRVAVSVAVRRAVGVDQRLVAGADR
ncbi:hypothetical protein [Amycolatopsis sp. DSM 110486]|uniref:hypothetical protein n=1 Tax=Amycolatopsis sp. DSM 110486 TaxID=2865832 RepID=UPI00351CD013